MAVTYADKPIIVEDDKVTIDAADLRALAELQVPEERAAFFGVARTPFAMPSLTFT